MASGAAGPPGDPAQEVKSQEPEAVTTPPPVEEAVTASAKARSKSHARRKTSSIYSESCTQAHMHMHMHSHIHTHHTLLVVLIWHQFVVCHHIYCKKPVFSSVELFVFLDV